MLHLEPSQPREWDLTPDMEGLLLREGIIKTLPSLELAGFYYLRLLSPTEEEEMVRAATKHYCCI